MFGGGEGVGWKRVGERIVYALLHCEGHQLKQHGSDRKFGKLRSLRKG